MKEVATVGAIFHARTILFHGIFVLILTQYHVCYFFREVYLYFCFAKPRADLPMYLIHVDFIHLLMFKIQ